MEAFDGATGFRERIGGKMISIRGQNTTGSTPDPRRPATSR